MNSVAKQSFAIAVLLSLTCIPGVLPAASITALGPDSTANAINNLGTVVGSISVSCGGGVASHAFSYSASGGMTDLGTSGTCSSFSSANGINDSGQIVGGFVNPKNGPQTQAFLDSGGVITDLGTFGGFDSTANAINSAGQIVGSYIISQGGSHVYMYSGGVFTDLGLDPFTFATASMRPEKWLVIP